MKTIYRYIICIVSLLFLNCTDTESHHKNCNNYHYQPNTIEGKWNLVTVTAGFSSFITNFPVGLITWEFDTTHQKVIIINSNTDPNLNDVFETGIYNYSIITSQANPEYCNQSIVIDTYNMGCLTISNNSLTMSTLEVDGLLIKLIR